MTGKKLKTGLLPLCGTCQSGKRLLSKNEKRRQQRSLQGSRRSPINAMDKKELSLEFAEKNVQLKKIARSNKRLMSNIEKTSREIKSEKMNEAIGLLGEAFALIVSQKENATKIPVLALIDMELFVQTTEAG